MNLHLTFEALVVDPVFGIATSSVELVLAPPSTVCCTAVAGKKEAISSHLSSCCSLSIAKGPAVS